MVAIDLLWEGDLMEKVIDSANSMAIDRTRIGLMYSKWKYGIKDNPYRHHKKNSVIWHNAFYDKCKEIGRRI